MKPLNIDKTGCSNISSNCVVWQGPDIECINLCKGDSVTEVVYKLAQELCGLMETFDLKNYDLKCFSSGVCQPQTFQDFINILITKVCALQACNPDCGDSCNPTSGGGGAVMSLMTGTGGGSEEYVPIAKEFQFKGPTGDDVTMLKVGDYAQAIGNKVSTLVNSVKGVQTALTEYGARIEALENAPAPTFQMPTVTPIGVLPRETTSMQLVLAATEQQFVELRTALGDSTSIYTNIQKVDSSINQLKSLSVPGTNLVNLQGFNSQPSNMADVVGNMLIMLKDMRGAITNIMQNYIPSDCDAISLDLSAVIRNDNMILFVNGKLPASTFMNTGSTPTVFTIADNHGSTVSYSIDLFSIINSPTGYTIPISETNLMLADNLTITANPSFTSKVNNSVCRSYLSYTVLNDVPCPSIVYTPSTTTIDFSFTSSSGTRGYIIELYDASGVTLVGSKTFVSTGVQTFTGTFTGLVTSTLYRAIVKVTKDQTEKSCEFINVTTV